MYVIIKWGLFCQVGQWFTIDKCMCHACGSTQVNTMVYDR